jgi:putative NADH-flavin reductase
MKHVCLALTVVLGGLLLGCQRATPRAINALEQLRREPELEWSFLAPSAELQSGQRTGKFRLGGDQLLVDAHGHSRISVEDYAVAMLDELEHPTHVRQRFTVGY